MIEPDASPVVPVRRRASFAWLLLLLAVLGVAWGWHAWRQRDAAASAAAIDAQQRIDGVEARLDSMRREQRAQADRLQQAEATNRVLRDELLGVGQRAALLEDSVSKLADPDRHGAQALRLDEVEMLLGMGRQRLDVASDLDGARRAYALASGMLDGVDDPAYLSLRQTMAQESAALDALGIDPVDAAAARLDAIETRLPTLPLVRNANEASQRAWWERMFGRLVDVQPVGASASSNDRNAGLEALRIELTLARAALERRDATAWRAALARADAWMPRLWPDTDALRAQRRALQALRAQPLVVHSPVLGSTLTQLRAMRARRQAP